MNDTTFTIYFTSLSIVQLYHCVRKANEHIRICNSWSEQLKVLQQILYKQHTPTTRCSRPVSYQPEPHTSCLLNENQVLSFYGKNAGEFLFYDKAYKRQTRREPTRSLFTIYNSFGTCHDYCQHSSGKPQQPKPDLLQNCSQL